MISVAAYCRVSTDRDDQANSYTAQQRFFREYIQKERDWELFSIYADEGISGTSTKKRVQFNRMLEDAQAGKFQLLLTKEVSRFARNILDAVYYTRALKTLGVGVIFLNDGIHTMEPDAELRLSILGSIAQEESRRTSQRVKWGQTRQMEQGVVFGHSLLGYEVHDGKLEVEPQGADIVQLIFQKYTLERKSSSRIAEDLEVLTGKKWHASHVIRILRNEKYVGDLIQKKTYTPNYLTHEKKINYGQEPLIVIKDHHPPIIPRALWEQTQSELKKRSRKAGTGEALTNQYSFSGKIYCGECGSIFVSKSKKRKDGSICRRWCCKSTTSCKIGKSLRDTLAKEALFVALHTLIPDVSAFAAQAAEFAIDGAVKASRKAKAQQQLQYEKLNRKLERTLDLGGSDQILIAELAKIYERFQAQLHHLQAGEINIPEREVLFQVSSDLLNHTIESDILIQTIVKRMTIYANRHMELQLTAIEQPFQFVFI